MPQPHRAAPRSRRSKAEWAEDMAKKMEDQAVKIRFESTAGRPGARSRKPDQLAHLAAEASKFRRLAAHYRRTGQ